MGVYHVIGDIVMVLGAISVTYVADYTGYLTVTFTPFLIPTLLSFAVSILMVWARDSPQKTSGRVHSPVRLSLPQVCAESKKVTLYIIRIA